MGARSSMLGNAGSTGHAMLNCFQGGLVQVSGKRRKGTQYSRLVGGGCHIVLLRDTLEAFSVLCI